MSVRTPNYALTEEHSVFRKNRTDPIVLPAGSFVRPLELCYVPKHVLEDPQWRYFDKEIEVFVFTKFGIVAVPKRLVKER